MFGENKKEARAHDNAGATAKTPDPESTSPDEATSPAIKMVPKWVVCSHCNGDGIWHSSATGVRAKTSSEPPVDSSRVCPKCKGQKKVTIMITEEQAKNEAAARRARDKANKTATQARVAADRAEDAAQRAEAKLE